MLERELAPGVTFESRANESTTSEVLRPDIAGFAGVFERGPLFVPRRIDDWGEQRALYGWFMRLRGRGRRAALGPLALYAFQQNGGGTAVVVRIGGRGMRPALATLPDPATGRLVGLVASSAGVWANGVTVSLPLRVRTRAAVPAFPWGGSLAEGSVVRVRASDGGIAFGTLERSPLGLVLSPPTALPGPFVVEVLDPTVDVSIQGAGIREQFRALSLHPASERYVWRSLAPRSRPGPEWQPRVPESWLPLSDHLALSLRVQGPGTSKLVRTEALDVPISAPETVPFPWLPPDDEVAKSSRMSLMTATLAGGLDVIRTVDVDAYRAAIELLAEHPLPSFVAIPDLSLPLVPEEDPCARNPDVTRLPPPVPPAAGCSDEEGDDGSATPGPTTDPLPPAEPDEDDDIPALAPPHLISETVGLLERELLDAIALRGDGRAERIALLDARPARAPSEVVLDALRIAGETERPELGALFYPWLRVLDPLEGGRSTTLVPPSGHVAGVMARTTRDAGPAARFANETLNGVVATERSLEVDERARLNLGQVDALHVVSGRGISVYGVRTLAMTAGPLRFVPASRVLAYVRRLARVVGQTLVFEPNDTFLRLRIGATLEAALHDLFLQGAFAGRTAAESYRVRCDEETTPETERQLGRVIALVDVALAVPLEFITIRVAFTRDGARVQDDIALGGDN